MERMMRTLLWTTLWLSTTSFWYFGNAYSAVSLVPRASSQHSRTTAAALKNDQEEVDSVTAEAEEAVRAANALLQDDTGVRKPPSSIPLTPEQQRQWIAATCSSTLVGGVLGFFMATQVDDGLLIEPVVLAGIGAVASGAATLVLAKDADEQNLVALGLRYALGKPLLAIMDAGLASVQNQIETTQREIAAIPTKVQETIEAQVRDTQRRVSQIPTQVQEKIQEKVSDTVASIQAIPVQVADAAQKAAEDALAEIQATPERIQKAALDIAEDVVTEIQATPDRLQKAAFDMAEEVVTEMQATPERLSEQAQRLADEVVAELKGGGDKIPQPPKRPPPMVPEEATTSLPKVELPKVELPKVELPKVELPKVALPSLPKVEIPKIAVSSKPSPDTRQQIQDAVRREQELLRQQREQELVQKQKEQEALQKQREQEQMKKQKEQEKQRQQEQFEQQKRKLQEAQQLAARKASAAAARAEQRRAPASNAKEAERLRVEQQRQEQERQKLKEQQERQRAEQQRQEQERQKSEQQRKEREAERQKQLELQQKAEQEKKEALRRSQEIEAQKKKEAELLKKKQQEEALRQRKEAEKQVTAQVQKQQATVSPGGSFRLFASKLNRAPRGVPTVVQWKQRRDGGISGRIYGSANFKDGERIETSAIASGTVDNGFVVKTDSGSRYFLSTEAPTAPATPDAEGPLQALLSALPGATITLTKSAQEKAAKVAAKKAAEPPAKKKPAESVAQPRPTFSLFGGTMAPPSGASKAAAPVSAAPRGVPTLRRWRVNRDGSVTGVIYGSSNFAEGERVTTSPIASGNLTNGSTVRTGSGSRYFLE